jgi:hypothetical protein
VNGAWDCADTKSQELDEGVPRVPDMRSQREQIESASPIAFAEIRIRLECMPNTNRREGYGALGVVL